MKKETLIWTLLVLALLSLSTTITPVMGAITHGRISFHGVGSYPNDYMGWRLGLYPDFVWDENGGFNPWDEWPEDPDMERLLSRLHPLEDAWFVVYGKGVLEKTLLDPEYLPPGEDVQAWELRKKEAWAFLLAKWTEEEDDTIITHELQIRFEIGDETNCVYGTCWTQAGPNPPKFFMETLWLGLNLDSLDLFPRTWPNQWVELLPRWDPQYATMTFEGTYDDEPVEGSATVLMAHFPDGDQGDMIFLNLWISGHDLYATFQWGNADSPPNIYFGRV